MSTAQWRLVPAVRVPLAWITLTQQHVFEDHIEAAMRDPSRSFCGDPLPHLFWEGERIFLEDGHHRFQAALRKGESSLLARLLLEPVKRAA